MNLLSWNCRGLGNSLAVQFLAGLVYQKRPNILFLCETWSDTRRLERVRVKLKYDNCFVVDSSGRGGGLALLWSAGVDVEVRGYSNHYIDTIVTSGGDDSRWRFTGFYGSPERGQRRESWGLLRYLSTLNNLPWALMGDFNDLLWDWEKEGRVPQPRWLLRGFGEAVRESGLSNFGFGGCQFTWEKGRGTCRWVREKLDRVLVSGEWRDLFPRAQAWSLEGTTSDHLPLFLSLDTGERTHYTRRPRFENSWGRYPDCKGVVQREWERLQGCPMGDRLRVCGRGVWNWGRRQNRGENEAMRLCLGEMERLRGRRDGEGLRLFGDCQRRYLSMLRDKSDRLGQRAKELWYKGGDTNSKFFHNSMNTRRRRNRITALRNSAGEITNDAHMMGGIMVEYFSNLFTSAEGDVRPVLDCLSTRIDEQQNAALLSDVTAEEVKGALFAMHPDKSPGPDGLSPAFFQMHWSILGPEVVSFVHLFMVTGRLPEHVNDTHIVLIPKCKSPVEMSEFRPIALCNVVYRILAKVLATRLRVLLDSIISPAQSAFIPGRSIVDNVLIAFESAHCLKRQPGERGGYGALKVDMSKAYDRVEWGFLCQVLVKMGFSDRWVGLVRECVTTVRYSVLVEGKEWGPVVPGRGLRQGDPLSPYLFILVAEVLSTMLQVREEEGLIHGLRVARGAPSISHLFFADDCLFLFRANNFEAEVLNDVLKDYGRASGQEVNLRKTSIVFGRNVHWEDKEAVCGTLGICEQQGRGKYLGLPGYVGRKKREILGFIRDRLRDRVMNWGNRLLSRGGREVLLKTVLQSIPNYAMNVFLLPLGLSGEIERIMNSFWWGCERRERGGIRWSRWSDLCMPKKFGGMGFRRAREMNLAMLGKQGWKFLTNSDALVTKVFKARYFQKCSFLEAGRGTNPSFVWTSIRETQSLIRKGTRWRIGNGNLARIWGDPWLPDETNPYVDTPAQEYLGNPSVSSLLCVNSREWDMGVLRDILCDRDVDRILRLPAPPGGVCDSLYWHKELNGMFSVKSAYRLAVGEVNHGEGVVWRGLWYLRIPPKVKCFFWRLCTLRLPTKDVLMTKRIQCDPVCVLCGKANECVAHLFANCEYAHNCWLHLNADWEMGYVDSLNAWLYEMWAVLPNKILEQVVMVAWAIWEARNSLLWKQTVSDPKILVHHALLYAENWRNSRGLGESTTHSVRPNRNGAQSPNLVSGEVRVKIDVSMDHANQRMGFGWGVLDEEDKVLGVTMFTKRGLYMVREAEAMGAREALSWIKHNGWRRVSLETDAQMVTNAVTGGVNISPFGSIVEEIRELLRQMPGVKFRYVHRNYNTFAHNLAKKALSYIGDDRLEFFDRIPRYLVVVGLVTNGLGTGIRKGRILSSPATGGLPWLLLMIGLGQVYGVFMFPPRLAAESAIHLFVNCTEAKRVWNLLGVPHLNAYAGMIVSGRVLRIIRPWWCSVPLIFWKGGVGRIRERDGWGWGGCYAMIVGGFMAAKNVLVTGNYLVKEAEALCIREALSCLKETGLGSVDVKMDSQIVFNAIRSVSFNSAFGYLVDDVKDLASVIEDIEFNFVKRSANRAAHFVAREAFSLSGCGEWLDSPHLFL
ncbi:PREDICTED: uncharacterized protein LOC109162266 [Ipomoea nil]|uniref:uncharacterized protein LOC109162266 n=1 Tax=Ipomoea nil TaxID=35883 RepID=UPI00090187D1|nr:PREDICTED: uncharacterized protein LOC109162266 [Ipomoea nil]